MLVGWNTDRETVNEAAVFAKLGGQMLGTGSADPHFVVVAVRSRSVLEVGRVSLLVVV
jgi:hypothetical protein